MNIGIVGATGLVGLEMLSVLQKSTLPVDKLRLLATSNSAGSTLTFRGLPHRVEIIQNASWEKGMFFLGATSSDVALEWVPDALAAGATVIDNSSAYRMRGDVPLVVPEVNPEALNDSHRLVANPNCSTIQLVMVLGPLAKVKTIEWVAVSTYQSVSGAGKSALKKLDAEERQKAKAGNFHRNVVCEIGDTETSGYTGEELKLINETAKILTADFPVFPACARVPVRFGHTESVTVKFSRPVSAEEIRQTLEHAPGVRVSDLGCQPLEVEGKDETVIGRIRNHINDKSIVQFWVTADNIRKGAALNAVQILETMAKKRPEPL